MITTEERANTLLDSVWDKASYIEFKDKLIDALKEQDKITRSNYDMIIYELEQGFLIDDDMTHIDEYKKRLRRHISEINTKAI